MLSERTERMIETLIPAAQLKARVFMALAPAQITEPGCEIEIISATRTYAQQDRLYAQGRTSPGKKITNAKGGYSLHNFGIAWDIGIFCNGVYVPESVMYGVIGRMAEGIGLEWGGRWKFVDEPHIQMRTGLTLLEMRLRKADGRAIV